MKLIFIEDEEDTRKGILKYVNWEKLGIDHVTAFSNPLEALVYVKKEPVDIVLSDIRMPHMDGIQLCRSILEWDPSANIIFISGYSDKEYLLSAIQLSAVDYVEKPINVPQLEQAIEKAVNRRLQTRFNQKDREAASTILQQNKQLYIDQFISDLIHGHTPNELPDSLMTELIRQMPLNDTGFYRVYLWRSRTNTIGFKDAIQTIRKTLADANIFPSLLMSQKDERTFLFVVHFPSVLACDSQKIDRLLSECLRLEHMEQFVSCSYGNLLQGYLNICESYNQAVLALQGIFFSDYGTILPYQEKLQISDNTAANPIAPLNTLAESIRKQDLTGCRQCLDDFFHTCRQRKDVLPDMIKNEYFKVLSLFVENRASMPLNHSSAMETTYLWKHINPLETLADCHCYTLSEAEQYFSSLDGISSDKKIILEVMRFVQSHYSEHNLYIEQIAEKVHMSPNYLSTLFKKETGKTIGNYITEVRLEQSCRLLKQTERKLYDIAQAVGYTDTNYYSKLFKKYYYLTPLEYRNKIINK